MPPRRLLEQAIGHAHGMRPLIQVVTGVFLNTAIESAGADKVRTRLDLALLRPGCGDDPTSADESAAGAFSFSIRSLPPNGF